MGLELDTRSDCTESLVKINSYDNLVMLYFRISNWLPWGYLCIKSLPNLLNHLDFNPRIGRAFASNLSVLWPRLLASSSIIFLFTILFILFGGTLGRSQLGWTNSGVIVLLCRFVVEAYPFDLRSDLVGIYRVQFQMACWDTFRYYKGCLSGRPFLRIGLWVASSVLGCSSSEFYSFDRFTPWYSICQPWTDFDVSLAPRGSWSRYTSQWFAYEPRGERWLSRLRKLVRLLSFWSLD